MARQSRFWIQEAIRRPGALRKQLGIRTGQKIPAEVLRRIAEAEIGEKVRVDGTMRVSPTLKKRAVLARTLRRLSKRGRRKRRRA